MHSIITNHPFVDGNVRTALTSAMAFLDRNGLETEPFDEDGAYDLTMAVATGKLTEVSAIGAESQHCCVIESASSQGMVARPGHRCAG